MTAPRTRRGAAAPFAALAAAALASGCVIVGRADPLPAPAAAPASVPAVVYAAGEFTFRMNDGEPEPSTFDGRLISAEIVDAWQTRGYVGEAERVDADELANTAATAVLISGSVHSESSFWLQLLNALTLTLWPYPVTQRYDVQAAVAPTAAGGPYVARARSADQLWVGLPLLLGLPFAERGHHEEVARMADALYADLRAQGAFETPAGAGPSAPPVSGAPTPADSRSE